MPQYYSTTAVKKTTARYLLDYSSLKNLLKGYHQSFLSQMYVQNKKKKPWSENSTTQQKKNKMKNVYTQESERLKKNSKENTTKEEKITAKFKQ